MASNDPEVLRHVIESPAFPASPAVWGPLQWQTMAQLLRGYPVHNPDPQTQQALRDYVAALVRLLPCKACASHWAQLAGTVQTASRYDALKWLIDTHNTVNQRLGKPQLTYKQAVDAMTKTSSVPPPCPECPNPQPKYIVPLGATLIGVLGAVVIVLAVLLAMCSRNRRGLQTQ